MNGKTSYINELEDDITMMAILNRFNTILYKSQLSFLQKLTS